MTAVIPDIMNMERKASPGRRKKALVKMATHPLLYDHGKNERKKSTGCPALTMRIVLKMRMPILMTINSIKVHKELKKSIAIQYVEKFSP